MLFCHIPGLFFFFSFFLLSSNSVLLPPRIISWYSQYACVRNWVNQFDVVKRLLIGQKIAVVRFRNLNIIKSPLFLIYDVGHPNGFFYYMPHVNMFTYNRAIYVPKTVTLVMFDLQTHLCNRYFPLILWVSFTNALHPY